MAKLKHAEGFTKAKTADNVSSHESPPFENISRTFLGLLLNVLDGELTLLLDGRFPVLTEVRFAESAGEESSTCGVFLWITHGKDTQTRKVSQLLIPDTLGELCRNGVDLLEALDI